MNGEDIMVSRRTEAPGESEMIVYEKGVSHQGHHSPPVGHPEHVGHAPRVVGVSGFAVGVAPGRLGLAQLFGGLQRVNTWRTV